MLQGGSSASVGGGGAAATGLVCSRVEVAAVAAGSGAGCRGGNGYGTGSARLRRCKDVRVLGEFEGGEDLPPRKGTTTSGIGFECPRLDLT